MKKNVVASYYPTTKAVESPGTLRLSKNVNGSALLMMKQNHRKSINMNILYLHGLDGTPRPDKLEMLKSKGANVAAPLINYRASIDKLDLFDSLSAIVKAASIDFIVGSSMGGYMGFYLSEYHNIQAFLFNPALHSKSSDVPVLKKKNFPGRILLLGRKDDVIKPELTEEFINNGKFKNIEIIYTDGGHQIPLDTFSIALDYI